MNSLRVRPGEEGDEGSPGSPPSRAFVTDAAKSHYDALEYAGVSVFGQESNMKVCHSPMTARPLCVAVRSLKTGVLQPLSS